MSLSMSLDHSFSCFRWRETKRDTKRERKRELIERGDLYWMFSGMDRYYGWGREAASPYNGGDPL